MTISSFVTIILISIASNLDNAGTGLAYGVRDIKIPWVYNFLIAFMGFALTMIGVIFGKGLKLILSPSVAQDIGAAVLMIIGVFVLIQPLLNKTTTNEAESSNTIIRILRNPEEADFDGSKSISFFEALVLSFALSINNMAGGFNAGVTDLNSWYTSILSGVFSYLAVAICVLIGRKYIAPKLGFLASALAGIILILLGLHQIYPLIHIGY